MSTFHNIFTVDLEEWFVVEILSNRYTKKEWEKLQSTVVDDSLALLNLLNHYNVKATWFVLGWVAEKYPELVQEIFQTGHEIACHSYYHRRVDTLSKDEFIADTEKAINSLIKAIGNAPFGYRAPSWSINNKNPWAFEILAELGFLYDSSIFPIKHDLYGWEDGPRYKFKMEFSKGKTIYEIPATTYHILGKNIPVAGGGYFRHSPYWYSKMIIKKINMKKQPAIFYIHPWEINSELPEIEGLSTLQRFRTYSSSELLKHKVEKLLTDFQFFTMAEYLELFKKKKIGFS
ncbi:MAG: DUF3473 domain-containing protein [Calditrichaeota bacterium]|nr:MAG: DUF3473 domain-containing protein [Calditrichota bacterium]